jgi:hypothetical protein
MSCSVEDYDRSRRHVAEDRGWSHRSGTQWPGDRDCALISRLTPTPYCPSSPRLYRRLSDIKKPELPLLLL